MKRALEHKVPPFSLWTPGNIITLIILAAGAVITVIRFTQGLAATTNLDDYNPWGLWIGFDVACGVALAAGGFTSSAAVYIFGQKQFHSVIRPALLTAFLGYGFVVVGLHYDLGRPLRLPYPIFYSQGTTSVLFEVGLCVMLYLNVLLLEFLPGPLETLGYKKLRNIVVKMTLPLVIFGIILSTMHQSSLGALFLAAPSKLHPLWYSPYLPVFFFVSAVFAGLSMVIFEGTLAHKGMHAYMDKTHLRESDGVTLAFAKGAAFVMFGYVFIKVYDIAMAHEWKYLATQYGTLFLCELFIGVIFPCILYTLGVRNRELSLIRTGSVLAVLGIIFNRLNVTMLAFNWQLPAELRYVPGFMEIAISVFIVTLIITVYRILCHFTPVLSEHPEYTGHH